MKTHVYVILLKYILWTIKCIRSLLQNVSINFMDYLGLYTVDTRIHHDELIGSQKVRFPLEHNVLLAWTASTYINITIKFPQVQIYITTFVRVLLCSNNPPPFFCFFVFFFFKLDSVLWNYVKTVLRWKTTLPTSCQASGTFGNEVFLLPVKHQVLLEMRSFNREMLPAAAINWFSCRQQYELMLATFVTWRAVNAIRLSKYRRTQKRQRS